MKPENVRFFDSAADFRAWLAANHETADYQWVGYPRKGGLAGKGGMKHADAVEEALCFGWIDGQGGKLGDDVLCVRFSKRRVGSIWSTVNVNRMHSLLEAGRVQPAGLRAWEYRRADRTSIYATDMEVLELPDELEATFRANAVAWEFWISLPKGYRRQMTYWVITAKRPETQRRRLDALIEEHAAGRRIDPLHMPRMSER